MLVHREPPGGRADRRAPHVQPDRHVAEEEPAADERLARVARRLVHDVEVGRVEAERGRGKAVRHQVHPEQLDGDERLGHAERRRQEDAHHLADVRRDEVADELLHVVVDGAALLHRRHDAREVVVGEDHLGRRLGDRRARAHRDADLRLLQRRRVVHAVTRLTDGQTRDVKRDGGERTHACSHTNRHARRYASR